jgi:hypothetical protein
VASETHIAGSDLEVDGRYLIQRCAWCGATLLAYDYRNTATVGEWRKPPVFPVGGLVRCTYDGAVATWGDATLDRTTKEVLDPDERLPDDACPRHIPLDR